MWVPATTAAGVAGLRFHDLRHAAATLAAASGTSVKALMARIGHASTSAALRDQNVIDGQDAETVDHLERFGQQHGDPAVPSRAHDDPPATAPIGHVVGTPPEPIDEAAAPQGSHQGRCGGGLAGEIPTPDPLHPKQPER